MVADKEMEDDHLVVSDGHRQYTDVWILDSAYSHYCTLNRSWFVIYTKIDEGSMTLRDDHLYKVTSIRIIRVRMFDGMVQTLTNMKHILELKKNLVSLGYLE